MCKSFVTVLLIAERSEASKRVQCQPTNVYMFIAKRLSARQLILQRVDSRLYVYMYVYISVTLWVPGGPRELTWERVHNEGHVISSGNESTPRTVQPGW